MSCAHPPGIRVTLLTLSFRPDLGVIDSRPLDALLATSDLLRLREHFFVLHGMPHMVCVVTHRPRQAAVAATEANAAPAAATPGTPRNRIELDADARARFEVLRRWRADRARRDGVPAYVLFNNRELAAIASRQPTSANALLQIDGVGDGKVARYGEELLALLTPNATETTALTAPGAA